MLTVEAGVNPSLDKLDPRPLASLRGAGGHGQRPRDGGPPLDSPGEGP